MKQRKQSVLVQPLDKPDIFYTDSVAYVDEDINGLPTKSAINDRRASYVSVHSVRFEGEKSHSKLVTMFANMLDLKVLTNCSFLLYIIGKVFFYLVIYMPGYSINVGSCLLKSYSVLPFLLSFMFPTSDRFSMSG